ncbi:MAG: histidine phosphatase family protein [Candidatus Thorarchaeota archaeon]
MTDLSDWESIEWLSSARSLVEWMSHRSPEESLMLFLRHSHREEIPDHSVQFSTGLTEIGKQMSYEMGKRLPASRPIRIFFSFVPRCYDTAEAIANGLRENGADIVEFEAIPILVMPEFDDEAVWENLQPDGKNVTQFVNRWADGEFGEMIESFESYRNRLMEATIERLRNENKSVIHIHVTHDLALMSIKRILLERSIGHRDREPFQGGICTSIDTEGVSYLYNSGQETRFSPID